MNELDHMSKTLERKYCPNCFKRNLCSWEYEGRTITRCKTEGCNARENIQQDYTHSTFVSATTLDFQYPNTHYRGISPEICEKLDIKVANIGDTQLISYGHYNLDGSLDIKRRYPNKVFDWEPKGKKNEDKDMFGLHLCKDFTKPLIITEGNEDTATLWELGYQACSILSAGLEMANITKQLDYINQFPEIIICIENDIAGKKASANIKELLKHKLLKEVNLSPRKDANEWIRDDIEGLVPDRLELINRIESAKELVPEGVIFGNQLDKKEYRQKPPAGIRSFVPGLNDSMGGYEFGCIYSLLAGSSTGKSTFLRHEVLNFRENYPNLKLACLFLEESQLITPQMFIALDNNIPIGKLKRDPNILSETNFNKSWDKLVNTDKLMFVNKHFKKDAENLINYIRYLTQVKKYEIIVIDHISYIIGRTASSKQGERKDVDKLVYDLQDLAIETNCIILFAAHVTDNSAQDSWDTGKVPSMYSGRSSKVLAQAPDGVIILSRNNIDPFLCDSLQVHCGKARWDGKTGLVNQFIYIHDTGRLILDDKR